MVTTNARRARHRRLRRCAMFLVAALLTAGHALAALPGGSTAGPRAELTNAPIVPRLAARFVAPFGALSGDRPEARIRILREGGACRVIDDWKRLRHGLRLWRRGGPDQPARALAPRHAADRLPALRVRARPGARGAGHGERLRRWIRQRIRLH